MPAAEESEVVDERFGCDGGRRSGRRWLRGLLLAIVASQLACAPIPYKEEDQAIVVGLYPAIGSAWYSDTDTNGSPISWKRRTVDLTLKVGLITFANVVTFGLPTLFGIVAEPARRWDPCYAADTCANVLFGFVKTKKAIVTRR